MTTGTPIKYRLGIRIPLGTSCLACGEMSAPLVVDHCHAHEWVRGGLCSSCNTSIGVFESTGAAPSWSRATEDALVAHVNRCPDCAPQHLASEYIPPEVVPVSTVRLSLTPEERREVRVAAANAGLSVSAWVACVAHAAVSGSRG